MLTDNKTLRGGAIIFKGDSVALLECIRNGEKSYSFPGGRMEPKDGTIEQTVIREIREELGLRVVPERLLAVFENDRSIHYYYAVTVVGGRFGRGNGPEFRSWEARCGKVEFRALWMPIHELKYRNVRPRQLADIVPLLKNQLPEEPLYLCERELAEAVNS